MGPVLNRGVCRRDLFSPLRLWLALGVVFFGIEACTGVSSVPAVTPEGVRTSEEVLAILHARESRIHSLKGLFQADIRGAHLPFSRRIHGTLFYQRPHSIRVTGLTRVGGRVFDFLLRGQVYALRVPERPDMIVGHVGDLRGLGDMSMPIQLSLHAVDLLLGKVPWASRSPDMRVDGQAYRYSVPVAFPPAMVPDGWPDSSGGRQYVWVDRYSAHMHTIEYRTSEEDTRLVLSASDFRLVDNGQDEQDGSHERQNRSDEQANALVLPFVINATDLTTAGLVELAFLELAANVALPSQSFHVR